MTRMTTSEDVAAVIERHRSRCPSDDEIRQFEPFRLGLPGQNIKFFAKSSSGSWLLKFCRNNDGRVPEVCEREVMTCLFGQSLGVPTVEAWVVPTWKLSENPVRHNREGDVIQDRFVLMRYINEEPCGSFAEDPTAAAERVRSRVPDIGNALAFLHSLGDEDRGVTDVMFERDNILLIDNGLCGPGTDEFLRGYHPTPDLFSRARIILKCYSWKKPFVEFLLEDLTLDPQQLGGSQMLDRIEAFPDDAIALICNSTGVNAAAARVLMTRKQTIKGDYAEWLQQAIELCRRDLDCW
jgi:hypothetical protein